MRKIALQPVSPHTCSFPFFTMCICHSGSGITMGLWLANIQRGGLHLVCNFTCTYLLPPLVFELKSNSFVDDAQPCRIKYAKMAFVLPPSLAGCASRASWHNLEPALNHAN